jgi:alkylation response protein AidB-like acyl-CoA dehydrogenase
MSLLGNTALEFTEEQAMLLEVARSFCRDRSPIAAVRAELGTANGFSDAIWREMVELGWCGIALPESCGGTGLGVGAVVPVAEAMGRALLGTPLLNSTLAGQLLLRAGGEAACGDLLAEIAGGSPATVALLENEDWGDPGVESALDAAGRLQGRKRFVGDAGVAALFVVPVTQGGETALAVVRAAQLGPDALRPHTLIDETRRAAEVDFSGVTPERVLTGSAVSPALRALHLLGALLVAAEAAGSAAACLDTVVDYLKTRRQFGRLIGSYQALKHPAVDILNAVDASRSLVYHAATLVEAGTLSRDAEVACRMAKAQASDTLVQAGDRAVQFHGGMGFTYECDAQLYIRRAQWVQQQFGDSRQHRRALAGLLLDAQPAGQ